MLNEVKHLGARRADARSNAMVWKRLFGARKDAETPTAPALPQPDEHGIVRRRPSAVDPAVQPRLDALRRRREMAAYDLDRAESARQEVNPWRERIALLDQSLDTIEDDLRALDDIPPLPPITLPETPIADVDVALAEPVAVSTEIQGVVDSVDMSKSPPVLSVNNTEYALDKIKRVVRSASLL